MEFCENNSFQNNIFPPHTSLHFSIPITRITPPPPYSVTAHNLLTTLEPCPHHPHHISTQLHLTSFSSPHHLLKLNLKPTKTTPTPTLTHTNIHPHQHSPTTTLTTPYLAKSTPHPIITPPSPPFLPSTYPTSKIHHIHHTHHTSLTTCTTPPYHCHPLNHHSHPPLSPPPTTN